MISDISSWVLSIAGIICLSVVVELIIPDGQMNRYIKGIFSFIIVLVIIMPVPKLIGSNRDYSNIFNYEDSIEIDEDYIYQINLDKLNSLKEDIEKDIINNGYKNVSVYINCNIFDNQMQIKTISVDLENLVITENAEHNDISKIRKHITKIILYYVEISEEEILYNV